MDLCGNQERSATYRGRVVVKLVSISAVNALEYFGDIIKFGLTVVLEEYKLCSHRFNKGMIVATPLHALFCMDSITEPFPFSSIFLTTGIVLKNLAPRRREKFQ